ncbi:hypothetical protein JCM6882_001944 [Rhodosporidiobolus microsporus]
MDSSIVPAKRSTPPAADSPTAAPAPRSPKQPRLDLSSSIDNGATNGAARKPKTASIFVKDAERQPEELRGPEEQLVDQQLEVEDAADYYEALLSIQTSLNRLHHPTRPQIRMLLSLCLFPLLFKPPTKSANPTFSRRGAPIASSSRSNSAQMGSTLLPESDEPLAKSYRKLREQALALLADVVGSSGTEVVCRAMRGAGKVETEREREARMKREEEEEKKWRLEEEKTRVKEEEDRLKAEQEQAAGVKGKKVIRVTNSRKHPSSSARRPTGPDTDDEEDFHPGDGDDPIVSSSKRIGQVEDLWDFLAGTTAQKPRVRTREKPVMDEGGWEVVRVLVLGWEKEHERKQQEKVEDDPPAPLSLLRYFKPSASSGFAREVSNKALDVVFWPFSEAATPKPSPSQDGEDDEDEEMSDEEKEKESATDDDGMRLQEKREVAVRLLGLIGSCAIDGYVSGSALLPEIVQRMKTLEPSSFAAFVELLSLAPLPSTFLSRLLTSFLETQSHSLTSTPDILPVPASSTLAASSSGPTSPRKRGLGSMASISSIDLPATSSAPPGSQQSQRSEATFWQTPASTSADFLALLARIPIEVPLESPLTDDVNARRPKLSLPKTFSRAQAAMDAFGVVKAALVTVAGGEGDLSEDRTEEMQAVLEKVQDKVDEARQRVEQPRAGVMEEEECAGDERVPAQMLFSSLSTLAVLVASSVASASPLVKRENNSSTPDVELFIPPTPPPLEWLYRAWVYCPADLLDQAIGPLGQRKAIPIVGGNVTMNDGMTGTIRDLGADWGLVDPKTGIFKADTRYHVVLDDADGAERNATDLYFQTYGPKQPNGSLHLSIKIETASRAYYHLNNMNVVGILNNRGRTADGIAHLQIDAYHMNDEWNQTTFINE